MKKIFQLNLFILASIFSVEAFSQLPNRNTYLIANIDNYQSYSALWGYIAPNGREYALLGASNGTSFVDITDTSNVHEVDFIEGPFSGWREIKTYSHYAYVVSEGTNSRLQIIDMQFLPDSVSLVSTWSYSGYTQTHAISQSGPYLYLSGGNACPNGGVQIIDVTNPALPIRRGNNTARYVHDARVLNDTIWACNINNQRISIINAGNKDNLSEIRNFPTLSGSPHNCDFSKNRKYLYVTHENMDPGKLEVWDVQDIENITFIRNWQPTGITTSITHNVEVYGDSAYIAHYTAGVRILDISNPSDPVEVAWYDTRPQDNSNTYNGCWTVYKFESGKIIASDIQNGLFVLRATFPTETQSNSSLEVRDFSLSQNYPNPFNPTTKIEFTLPVNGIVNLQVYDLNGNLIKKLAAGNKSKGKHIVEFDASEVNNLLASGIYFYKLEFSGLGTKQSIVRKMTFIK